MTSTIPAITDPLGRHWEQPNRADILIDDQNAVMAESEFVRLSEYSLSIPTGVYPGKMWKARVAEDWVLRWYGPEEDGRCRIMQRTILMA